MKKITQAKAWLRKSRVCSFLKKLGQKVAERKFPESPNFLPNFALNFPRISRGVFVLCFVGNGDQKKFTKNPRPFSMQNSQRNTKKNIHKNGLESRQSKEKVSTAPSFLRSGVTGTLQRMSMLLFKESRKQPQPSRVF